MITLSGPQLALVSAAVARVNSSEHVRWNYASKESLGIEEIRLEVGAESFSVYDIKKVRHVRFDFPEGSLEIAVRDTPKPQVDEKPDGDGPPPGQAPAFNEPVRLAA